MFNYLAGKADLDIAVPCAKLSSRVNNAPTRLNLKPTCDANVVTWVPLYSSSLLPMGENFLPRLYTCPKEPTTWNFEREGTAYKCVPLYFSSYPQLHVLFNEWYQYHLSAWHEEQHRATGVSESIILESYYDFEVYTLSHGLTSYVARVWSDYVHDPEGERRKRIQRKLAASIGVSKGGRLRHLLPSYVQESLEARAEEEAIHLEQITLAEEHSASIRLLRACRKLCRCWSVWKTWLQRLSSSLGSPYWPISCSSAFTPFISVRAALS